MKRCIKNILFLLFISFAFVTNVSAHSNFEQIQLLNSLDYNLQNSLLVENIEYKMFEDNAIICSGEFGNYLKDAFHIVKFAVPIIIIGLGMMDFIKAIMAQNQDEIKKASSKLIKRLIIGMFIFALPTILDYLLRIAEINSELCGW